MHVTYCTIRRGVLIKKVIACFRKRISDTCYTITYEFSTWGSNI